MFNKLSFLKVYFSPFKIVKPNFYFGNIKLGTPYFLPRKWVYSSDGKSYAVSKKIGFDFVGLGWKTKWEDTDYRFEWSPIWSFVFFKWQLAIKFIAPHEDMYWECFLYYTNNTDKTKTIKERLIQAKKEFPCIWTKHNKYKEETICYWDLILKDKYNKK